MLGFTLGTAKEYLEKEVFPTLLPALEEMLQAAKDNDVLKVNIYSLKTSKDNDALQNFYNKRIVLSNVTIKLSRKRARNKMARRCHTAMPIFICLCAMLT